MSIALNVLDLLLEIFKWILLVRIVIEMIQSFSRNFRPPRWFAVIADPLPAHPSPPIEGVGGFPPPRGGGGSGARFIGARLVLRDHDSTDDSALFDLTEGSQIFPKNTVVSRVESKIFTSSLHYWGIKH